LRPRARWGSKPSPPATGLGSIVTSPVEFGAEPGPPKGFPLFSTLRTASPDAIIVDYYAAIEGQDPPSIRPHYSE